jgi:hypothetical protein
MMVSLWVPKEEPHFNWWTLHEADGNREVYVALIGEHGHPMEGTTHGTMIEGIVWLSGKMRRAFYETHNRGLNDGNYEHAAGFVRYAHKGNGQFKTWEEALEWVHSRDRS